MSEIRLASELLFEEILREIVLRTTISAHKEIKRGRQICGVCGTKCRSHNPLSTSQPPRPASQSSYAPPSRAPSPFPPSNISSSSSLTDPPTTAGGGRTGGYIAGPEKGTGGSTGIGSGSGRMDASGNVFFACLICDRQVVSSKYAPHLSSCLGMNGSTRRTASRSAAAAKAKMQGTGQGSQTSERSASPYVASEGGDSDDGSVGGKKGKKSLSGSVNGNGKRGPSPKKPGPAIKKARGSNGGTPSPLPRPTLPPSKLGRPPTMSSTAYLSSPSPSPVPSLPSIADSGGTGGTARKTVPGLAVNVPAVPALVVQDDDSDADDY